jgi:hypothetical protein
MRNTSVWLAAATLLYGCGASRAGLPRQAASPPTSETKAPNLARTAVIMLGLSDASYAEHNLAAGEHASVVVMCWGCRPDTPESCVATLSLHVARPDGSIFLSKDLGEVHPQYPLGGVRAVQVLGGVSLDVPSDAQAGEWTIRAQGHWVDGVELNLEHRIPVITQRGEPRGGPTRG